MGRRHKPKAKKEGGEGTTAEGQQKPQPDYVRSVDPPRAAVAVHPSGAAIAVACGLQLRVYDARNQQFKVLVDAVEDPTAQQQLKGGSKGSPPYVRGVAFDASGRYLLAGGEDKTAGLRVWDCATWQLLQAIKVPKKVTTCTFTPDGAHVLAADKFGDVLAAATLPPAGLASEQSQEPQLLLGHFCAILTSLSLSAGGRFLATTDRDHRVRVSVMPRQPLEGAHEIQSFCLGHTAYATASAFVQRGEQELLVTGGGDGTLRLWDHLSGRLLHTLHLPSDQQEGQGGGGGEQAAAAAAAEQEAEAEAAAAGAEAEAEEEAEAEAAADDAEAEAEAEEEAEAAEAGPEGDERPGGGAEAAAADGAAVPLALAAAPDGEHLVAAVDGRDALCLLRVDWSAQQLRQAGWCALPGLHLPASLAFDAAGRLWAAGGPIADDSPAAFLACATIVAAAAADEKDGESGESSRLESAPLPDWLPAAAAAQLEAKRGDEAAALAAAAERRRLASQLLQKRRYNLAQLEGRKRRRRDKAAAADAGHGEGQQEQSGELQA